jgi:hypothetical protein
VDAVSVAFPQAVKNKETWLHVVDSTPDEGGPSKNTIKVTRPDGTVTEEEYQPGHYIPLFADAP